VIGFQKGDTEAQVRAMIRGASAEGPVPGGEDLVFVLAPDLLQ
jgi:hypothetical protein